MKSSFGIFLLLCGVAVGQINYIYVNKTMNWTSAQTYCMGNRMDLATVTTNEENGRLMKAAAASGGFKGWIGLSRVAPGSDVWQWSDGEPPRFFKWKVGEPNNSNNTEDCVVVFLSGWNDNNCKAAYPLYCSWESLLVTEPKTLEEALDYCRTYHKGLASLSSTEQQTLAGILTVQNQTVSVWAGLRFLNGEWFTVNRLIPRSLDALPSCPAPRRRCGAYNTQKRLWENRDCNEKLNFFCY